MSSWTSDPGLRLALGLGLAALLATTGLVLQVLLMRARAQRRALRRQALHTQWRPLLMRAALEGEGGDLPALPTGALLDDWLLQWNQLQDSLRGGAHEGLNRLAQALGVPALARRRAAEGAASAQVLGLLTLGHLGDAADLPRLLTAMRTPRTAVSLAAARALMQVDAASAAPAVLREFLAREDWPVARLGTLVRGDAAVHVAPPLLALLEGGEEGAQQRLLPLLRFVDAPRARTALLSLIERSRSPQLLSMALRQLEDPAGLPRVRALAAHDDALVRSAAALALGRLGDASDRTRLLALMADRDWWVRYRAAQALLALPGVDAAALDTLAQGLQDRYARDVLRQVRAERALELAPAERSPAPAASTA